MFNLQNHSTGQFNTQVVSLCFVGNVFRTFLNKFLCRLFDFKTTKDEQAG
jgi:hypothetical protein